MPAPVCSWQRAYGGAVVSGDLRVAPEDFRVTEIAAFDFSGDGEHEYLWLEKRGANTAWVARQLARHAGVPVADIGYAGLKDRHAVTRQWFSVRGGAANWDELVLPGVRILQRERHRKKLRRGVHRGNEFQIVLRNINRLGEGLQDRLELIAAAGVANYFAAQRFGTDAGNLDLASRLFAGERLQRAARSMAISAARSFLFNEVLAARVAQGSWNRILPGECANLAGSNSVFRVSVIDDELIGRCERMDIHPSGPLWGHGETLVEAEVAAVEQSVVAQHAELARGLEAIAEHARRPLRVAVGDLSWEERDQQLQLRFALPSGAYATTVLGEIAEFRDCPGGRDR